MPFSNVINAELGAVILIAKGYCTTKELVEKEAETFKDPQRRPNMKLIIDLRLANIDADLDSIKTMIARNRELKHSGWELEKTALITKNHLLVSLARAYELMGDGLHLKMTICDTLEEAITWLGLDAEKERVLAIHQHMLDELAQSA